MFTSLEMSHVYVLHGTNISISLRENSELEREIKTSEKIVKIVVIFPLYITVSS